MVYDFWLESEKGGFEKKVTNLAKMVKMFRKSRKSPEIRPFRPKNHFKRPFLLKSDPLNLKFAENHRVVNPRIWPTVVNRNKCPETHNRMSLIKLYFVLLDMNMIDSVACLIVK